jgi:hypothetical protein
VTGAGARFWLSCAVFLSPAVWCIAAPPIAFFLSGVPESVKSLCRIMPKTRAKHAVSGGLVFSW